MKKSCLLRVVPDLKFLSEKSAEKQQEWISEITNIKILNTELLSEAGQLRTAVKEMSSRNEDLTRDLADANETKKKVGDLCKRISEENERLSFMLKVKEGQLDSANTKMQTVETELEGGARIKIQVPKPQITRIPTEPIDRQKFQDLLK